MADEAVEQRLAEIRRRRRFLLNRLEGALAMTAGGAVPTEQIAPERLLEEPDPSIARTAGTAFLHNLATIPDAAAALGTVALSPFIPELPDKGAGAVGKILAPLKLKTAGRVAGAAGRAVEAAVPGVREFREASAVGAERETEALKGEDPSLLRRAGVLGLEVLSDPIELLPGGVGLKSIRLTTAGAIAGGALAAVGTRAAARKLLKGPALRDLTSRGIVEGLQEEGLVRRGLFAEGQAQAATARRAAETAQREALAQAQAEYAKEVARQSRRIAEEMVNFPFAPTAVQKPVAGQAEALKTALSLERTRRRFAPTLQTAGPGAGRAFHKRLGPSTTEPFGQIQSQLAREPVTGTTVGGGLPASFAGKRVEAAVVPMTDVADVTSSRAFVREMAEGPSEVALRAEEFARSVQPGKGPVRRSIPVRSGLEETIDEAGNIINPRRWQQTLANLFSSDNMLGRFMAVRRANEMRDLVLRISREPSSLATYGQMARRLKTNVADVIDSDLLALTQNSGNAMVGKADTVEAVRARLDTLAGIDQLKGQVEMFRKMSDDLIADANDLNATIGQKEIPYRDNYIHQEWQNPRVFRNWLSTRAKAKGSPEFQRQFVTYHDGVHIGGLKPVSLRFSDNMEITEMHYARSLASKRALQQMALANATDGGADAFQRFDTPRSLPKDYIQIDNRDLSKIVEGRGGIIGVHRSIAPVVRNLLAERSFGTIDELLSFAKMNNLGVSTFHHFTLAAESSPALLGPVHGLRASARLGFGAPGIAPHVRGNRDLAAVSSLLESGRRAGRGSDLPVGLRGNQLAEEAWARAAKHGVTGEPISDVHRAAWQAMAGEVLNVWDKIPVARLGRGMGELAVKFQESINRSLWDGFHTPIKVYAFNTIYDGLLQVKRGNWRFAGPAKRWQRKQLAKLSDEEIGDRVGKIVNDEFGGQLWEGHVGKFAEFLTRRGTSPVEAADFMRKWMLSPDWLISSVRMGTHVAAGAMANDPVRMILGARHWKNFALGAAVYANLTNYVFTKVAGGEGKFIFDDDLRRSQFHVRTPFRDRKTGEIIYARWGKQFQEIKPIIDAVRGLVAQQGGGISETREILERKLNPAVAALIHLALPPEDFPTPLQRAERRAADEGRELTDPETLMWAGITLVQEGLVPFSFRDTGVPLAPVAIAKGIDVQDAEFNLVDAMEDQDFERVQEILHRLSESENLQGEPIQQILNRAERRLRFRQGLIQPKTEEDVNLSRRRPR